MTDGVTITEPVLMVRLPQTFSPGMPDAALYEAARGIWKVGPLRERVQYVFAIHAGIVQEVYEVESWQPAGTATYETRTFDPAELRGRWEFVGRKASDSVRLKYLGNSVADHFPPGAQNPLRYVNVG